MFVYVYTNNYGECWFGNSKCIINLINNLQTSTQSDQTTNQENRLFQQNGLRKHVKTIKIIKI